jgi:hypothetical protein
VTVTRTTSTLVLGAALAVLAALAAALALASPATSATTSSECGKKVLADWFDNGRIDRLYPLHCYEDAIDLIPKDLLPYADAEEVISRALLQALRGEVGPGGCDPSPDGSGDDCKPGGKKNNGSNGGSTTDGETTTGSEAVPEVDTSAATSVPVPLLVLGGMSVALLAAGGLGYASRRRQGVDGDDPGDDPLL